MTSQKTKKFLAQRQSKVKVPYLLTADEIKQKISTIQLFQKFDEDNSGALDANEL